MREGNKQFKIKIMSKVDLKKFKDKVYNWACSFEEYGPKELKEFKEFINSEEFNTKVIQLEKTCVNLKEFNIKLTNIISDKFKDLTLRCEHNISIKNILDENDIFMN